MSSASRSKLSSTPPRQAERSDTNMFGPRRGYDAIGEPSVSNADKPRVQPVKVDPKVLFSASRGVATPPRRRRASSLGEEVLAVFFFRF